MQVSPKKVFILTTEFYNNKILKVSRGSPGMKGRKGVAGGVAEVGESVKNLQRTWNSLRDKMQPGAR